MEKLQRFMALWVVTIIFGAVLAFIFGSLMYVLATNIAEEISGTLETLSYEQFRQEADPCWQSVFFDTCLRDRINYLGMYPLFSILITIPGYVLFRAVVGSFKVVFKK
jgi:hypothetical protein